MVITASCPVYESGRPVTNIHRDGSESFGDRDGVHDSLFGAPTILVLLAGYALAAVLHHVGSYTRPPESSGYSLVCFCAAQVSRCSGRVEFSQYLILHVVVVWDHKLKSSALDSPQPFADASKGAFSGLSRSSRLGSGLVCQFQPRLVLCVLWYIGL